LGTWLDEEASTAISSRMRLLISTIVLFCFCTITTFAQNNYAVKGLVTDTSTNTKLDKATICVMSAKDSILLKFVYTNKGTFNIANLKPGKYLIMVTYPDYADFAENFTLNVAHPVQNFGNISLILKAKLLNEVIIKARVAAIKIKGDTTEFNAAAYITQKNAKVEDLLKQLPGMRINQSGVILFQGETVDKILVDGEEFFGDDPTLVTKNVRADMVSRIQVYNQKSDAAKRTGIEDGVKVKTINVQLREDKKVGVFGKVQGDVGTDKFYSGQAMFNKFSPKQKIAAYGNIGNTGQVGLSNSDNSKFGGGSGIANYNGMGLPLAQDGGVHYDSKWNKDKESINANYKLSGLNIDGTGNTLVQNNLPGNFNKSNQDKAFHNYSFNQALDANFGAKIDSTSDLYVSLYGYKRANSYNDVNTTTTWRGNGVLLNTNNATSTGDNDFKSFYVYGNYNKRFKKKGRSISLNVSTSLNETNSNSYLKSTLKYYNNLGIQDSLKNIDQYKPGTAKTNSVSAGLSFTEPLSKLFSLRASYNISRSISDNYAGSFNKSITTNLYDTPDPIFSSDFKLVNVSNIYGAYISYSNTRTYFNFGTSVSDVSYKQTDKLTDTLLSRNFINWRPTASFRYQLSKAASLSFDYAGTTNQPSLYQLQPLRQNADPLNVSIGNPGLRPDFNNRVSAYYRVYRPTLDQGINLRGSYNNALNAIVNNRTTDSAGVNIYQWSNLKERHPTSWNVYAEVYGHMPKADFIVSISFSANGSTSYNYINKRLNEDNTVTYNPRIDIWKNKTTYNYSFSIGPIYTISGTSLQQINNNSHGYFTDLGYYTKLPLNFFIGTNVNYTFTAKNQVFDHDYSKLLLKSYLGKSFLKQENLKISITGNDMLNQNTGYRRSGSADSYTEERNTTIGRYFMFSVTWDFSKFGKSLQKQ
jgi:hypothetical protein